MNTPSDPTSQDETVFIGLRVDEGPLRAVSLAGFIASKPNLDAGEIRALRDLQPGQELHLRAGAEDELVVKRLPAKSWSEHTFRCSRCDQICRAAQEDIAAARADDPEMIDATDRVVVRRVGGFGFFTCTSCLEGVDYPGERVPAFTGGSTYRFPGWYGSTYRHKPLRLQSGGYVFDVRSGEDVSGPFASDYDAALAAALYCATWHYCHGAWLATFAGDVYITSVDEYSAGRPLITQQGFDAEQPTLTMPTLLSDAASNYPPGVFECADRLFPACPRCSSRDADRNGECLTPTCRAASGLTAAEAHQDTDPFAALAALLRAIDSGALGSPMAVERFEATLRAVRRLVPLAPEETGGYPAATVAWTNREEGCVVVLVRQFDSAAREDLDRSSHGQNVGTPASPDVCRRFVGLAVDAAMESLHFPEDFPAP
jgi:hypothetical protein